MENHIQHTLCYINRLLGARMAIAVHGGWTPLNLPSNKNLFGFETEA